MLRTIIIEDEQPARDLIRYYLSKHADIELAGEYPDGFTGLKAIHELKPDLVFLDVQMPKLTGFEMLELLEDHPHIVFTTAFDQFAIKAFEMNAVDYLLKPYSQERFDSAIQKVFDRSGNENNAKVKRLAEHFTETREMLDRIVVKIGSKIKVIPVETIFLESQDDYVMIYTPEGKFLKQQTMKYFEIHLNTSTFCRIHRSYLANINNIKQLELYEKNAYLAVLSNGAKLKVSDAGYKALKNVMKF